MSIKRFYHSTCRADKCDKDAHGAMFCSLECFEEHAKNPPPKPKTPNSAASRERQEQADIIDQILGDDEAWDAWMMTEEGADLTAENLAIAKEVNGNVDEEIHSFLKKTAEDFAGKQSPKRVAESCLSSNDRNRSVPKVHGSVGQTKENSEDVENLVTRIWPMVVSSNDDKSDRILI